MASGEWQAVWTNDDYSLFALASLAIIVSLVPVIGPRPDNPLDLGVVGIPRLDRRCVDARWHRRIRHRGKRPQLDHQRLPLARQRPVHEQPRGIRVRRALGDAGTE